MTKKIRKMLLSIAFVLMIGCFAGSVCTTNANAATLSAKAEKAYKKKVKAIKKEAAAKSKRLYGYDEDYHMVYYFLDVDGDGKKEMLLQDYYQFYSAYPAEVYKYKGGKVVRILKVGSGNDSWWNYEFIRYYAKTKTLVFESSHNMGTPTVRRYYQWNGKKFVLKVTQEINNYDHSSTYEKGSSSLMRKLKKGSYKSASKLTAHTCY